MVVPCITQFSCYRTNSLPNDRRFPFPSRPLPRCLVTEQVDRQVNDVVHFRLNQYLDGSLPNRFITESPMFSITVPIIAITAIFPRASSYCGRITAIPSHCRDCRRFTPITVGLPRLRLIPVITAGFPFPSRPVPRFVVTECVCRHVADAFYFCPDHYRGVSYQVRLLLNCGHFLLPS